MSQPSSQKKRRPPLRLSWPASLSQGSTASIGKGPTLKDNLKQQEIRWDQRHKDDASGKGTNISGRKRARKADNHTQNTVMDEYNNTNNVVMWVEKFAPKSSSELCVAPKKLKEIKSWVQNSMSSISKSQQQQQKLLVLVGSPGIGKSTTIRIIARELNTSILSWNESFHQRTSTDIHSGGLFSVEQTSALNSFNEFLQQSGSGIASLQVVSSSEDRSINNSNAIILLEDLPNLHGVSAELRFRNMMSRHLQRSHVPTILVFSDVSEGRHRPEDLERLINPDILYDNEQTTIMQIQPVTKPKMKKVLTAIAKQENCRFSTNFFEEIHHQSNGDIRHAIMTLQLHATGRPKAKSGTITLGNEGQNNRDTKLSTFHSLGKLLYAKRALDVNGDSRLAFDPETILQRSDLGIEGSLRFLEFHSVDFFTDITELSRAYSSFSDVADMLGYATAPGRNRGIHDGSSSVFPYDCASSIAGRTVANTNIHPAPNKFRQFSRPKVFDVMRNGFQNQILVDQLSRRLSTTSCQSSSVSTFVTESLPFVRQISPQEVDPYLDNLYSVAMQKQKEKLGPENVKDEEQLSFQKDQQALLEMDDIDEFDSD
jgi:cell cycle checkpoint protein